MPPPEDDLAFLDQDFTPFNSGMFPFPPTNSASLKSTILNPLNLLGVETLIHQSSDGIISLPLIKDRSKTPPTAAGLGPAPYEHDQFRAAIDFMKILLSEQLKEFEPEDSTVIESQLLLVDLFLRAKKLARAKSVLSELNRLVETGITEDKYKSLIQLLQLQCDEQHQKKVAQSRIDSIKSQLQSMDLPQTLYEQLLARIPKASAASEAP